MSYSINGNNINLTRGDTLIVKVDIVNSDGSDYILQEGDVVRFAMSKTYNSTEPLILKDIPIDTLILKLDPEDTKQLPFGMYVYDIELTTVSGVVDTFISKAQMHITEEVC